jgi:hypothetical protein
MEIVSDDDEDGGAGTDTGALSAIVYGLDSGFNEVSQTINLNGTAPVPLDDQNLLRVYRIIVLTAGSVGTNVGEIDVREIATPANIYAGVQIGDGQTQMAIYTIPSGKSGYFIKGYVGIGAGGSPVSNEDALFKWKARINPDANGAWATKGQIDVTTSGSNWWQYEYGASAGPLPEKTDIKIECTSTSATLGVVGGFDLLLVDN